MNTNELLNNLYSNGQLNSVADSATALKNRKKPSLLNGFARNLVIGQLERLHTGRITLIEEPGRNNGQQVINHFGRLTDEFPIGATIVVHNPQFYCDLAFGGSIGAGESYMLGHWSSDALANIIRIMARNEDVMDDMESGMARVTTPIRKTLHWFNRNSKQGSRKNIAAHYDIGNDFFALFLDPTMMYSSGIFAQENDSMEQASLNKLHRICEKLKLSENDKVVEIGTGWGGFAIFAAQNYGCHVTTTTISKEQYDLALRRIQHFGLEDKITVLLKDYREMEDQFDKLVSIEMIEAVGHEYYDTYFKQCASLLKPDGAMLIQAITIADQRYEQAKRDVDFIQRYIFPGSCIPSNTALLTSVTRSTDLRLFHMEDIGPHYATTLRKWREQFFSNLDKVRKLGYSEEFIRMWDFYLCYCEGGFLERAISDVHLLFTKPQNRLDPILPAILAEIDGVNA